MRKREIDRNKCREIKTESDVLWTKQIFYRKEISLNRKIITSWNLIKETVLKLYLYNLQINVILFKTQIIIYSEYIFIKMILPFFGVVKIKSLYICESKYKYENRNKIRLYIYIDFECASFYQRFPLLLSHQIVLFASLTREFIGQ